MKPKNETVCLACSIFKNEVVILKQNGEFDLKVLYQPSMLHMKPDVLDQRLAKEKIKFGAEKKNIVLLFGDCCPYMDKIENEGRVIRTEGINCIEILLGKKPYRTLRKEGAFFLMPEWTCRWEEVFKHELQLDGDIAREFMKDFHSKIIYLDTGNIDIPYKHLEEIENYSGLKV